MTRATSLQKYRMYAKEHAQKAAQKQLSPTASQTLGGDGLKIMLRDLGKVGLRAMLEANELTGQSHTVPGKDSLAYTEQVRSAILCYHFSALWAAYVDLRRKCLPHSRRTAICIPNCLAHCDVDFSQLSQPVQDASSYQ